MEGEKSISNLYINNLTLKLFTISDLSIKQYFCSLNIPSISAIVFGKRKRDQISNEPENFILSDNLEETNDAAAGGREDEEQPDEHVHSTSASRSKQGKQDRQGVRPLLDEVTMLNSAASKNP
ncbi:hypothetical protein V6N13_032482 [Hibiscus sabdariffa]